MKQESRGFIPGSVNRQLLAFSRRQVLQPQILDVNEILTGSRSMLERVIGESIRVEFSPDPELRPVKADQTQLEQVIMNLALNARDAMPTGGTLILSTRNGTVPAEHARRHLEASPGEYVRLSVVDTGVGMAREVRARVFEPFFTTKASDQGTGLGLPTVQGIVAQSGGFIELESEQGEGTRVHVYLPVAPLTLTPELIGEESRSAPGSQPATGVILVVEDQEPVRRVARRILERSGHTVLEALNGDSALELIRSGREPIDLVLTDMVMPGMGGRELAARVQAEGSTLPFVFMSGYAEEEILRDSDGSKPLRVLEKPFSPYELSTAVAEALSE